jgi:hypothetical protein
MPYENNIAFRVIAHIHQEISLTIVNIPAKMCFSPIEYLFKKTILKNKENISIT